MIRNNLAVLLAQKQIKISRMALDTGLSRTTLTALSQNESKRIDNDTLNVILMYLKITPNDFFNFLKYDFEIQIETNSFDINFETFNGEQTMITMNEASFDLFIRLDDKISSRKPVYEFEITVDKKQNVSHSESIYNSIENDADEVFFSNILFNIGSFESIKIFQDFADREIPKEFQTELSTKIVKNLKNIFISETLKKFPNASVSYIEEVADNLDLVSPITFLDLLLF
ncbi:helix-turn-helix domain-containing protein [Lactococcus lactis]|uniref:helix-turn-helix domain-containing protein n=1 Tax=Lactococcus lactis TaxID=1358 RepID=UPI00129DB268|nr:helix-turn-helix transcriptional regulator [Lactococcus lactis]MDM7500720.1 helix-turn-helix transcriptional regulator [Lactococcus lactis]MRL87987.1 helix-turn-helix domain-containing protein [Lactococcus cremoris]